MYIGAANISIEEIAIGSTIVILTVLFPYSHGNREIWQTKFQTAGQPSGLTGFNGVHAVFMFSLTRAIEDMYMYILYTIATKWRADLKAFLYIFP